MNETLYAHAWKIAREAIIAVSPEAAVRRALEGRSFGGKLYLVAIGKAGWKMAETALACLSHTVERGIVVTKYRHVAHLLPIFQSIALPDYGDLILSVPSGNLPAKFTMHPKSIFVDCQDVINQQLLPY